MFGLFKKKDNWLRAVDDKIWMTRARYYEGIFQDAQVLAQSGRLVIITSFFQKTIDELAFVLKIAGLSFTSLSDLGEASLVGENIYLTSVDSILAFRQIGKLQNVPAAILVAGHYPITSKQDVLEAHLKIAQSVVMEIGYYNSMDSPLFKIFASDKIVELLQKMGMKPEEQITHSMISKSIRKAQLKLTSAIRDERVAQSEEEWFALNKRD